MSSRKRQAKPRVSGVSGDAPSNATNKEGPFHILMAKNGAPLDASKLTLKGRLRRDHLSKRNRLIQMMNRTDPASSATSTTASSSSSPSRKKDRKISARERKPSEPFWSGATSIEMALLSCCELPKQQARDEEYVVPGALSYPKIPKFIGLTAVDCHDLSSRALALAILERTWEADEEQKEVLKAYSESGQAVAVSRKAPKLSDGSSPGGSSIAKIGIQGKADRLMTFFAGGGLRVLSQWLLDATTPVFCAPPKEPPETEQEKSLRPKRTPPTEIWKPAKTGNLLLPLLILLTYSPFDKDLVTSSKIHKQIAKLSKATDALVAEAEQNPRKISLKSYTDPKVGGLLVKNVQKSLNDLKASWRAKEKQKDEATPSPVDPFAKIKAALADRLEEGKRYDKGECDKPLWMAKAEKLAASQKRSKSPNKNRVSTIELAKLERQKERQERMKGDLKKAAAERAALLEKLRQMKQQKEEQEASYRQQEQTRKLKTVKWKDGESSTSCLRIRDRLETVHMIFRGDEESSEVAEGSK